MCSISKFSLYAVFSHPILSASQANFFLFPDHSNVSAIIDSEKALNKKSLLCWVRSWRYVWLDYFLNEIRADFQIQTMRRWHSEDRPICICPLKFIVFFILTLLAKSWHLLLASGIRKGEEWGKLAGKNDWGWMKVWAHFITSVHFMAKATNTTKLDINGIRKV